MDLCDGIKLKGFKWMNIVILVVFIFALFTFFITFGLLPSLINLILTYLFILPLWKKTKSFLLAIPLFLFISFILGLNTRLIGIVEDITTPKITSTISTNKIQLSYGSKVALKSDIDLISYKKFPLENPELSGDAGCMCTYYNNPKIIHENFTKELTSLGLIVSEDADTVITINSASDDYLTTLSVGIRHLGKRIANRSFRIRNKFYGDFDLNIKSRIKDGGLLLHLSKNNFWNSFLESSPAFDVQDSVVTNFIKQHLSITSSMKELVTLEAIPIKKIESQDGFTISRGRSGDITRCNQAPVYDDYKIYRGLHIKHNGYVIPIENSLDFSIEKKICSKDLIYFISTPQKGREYFLIKAFDYQGRNSSNQKYRVPPRKWQGVPRKPLIYFKLNNNEIDIGIQEFGREMEGIKNIYYRLPLIFDTDK